VKGIPKLRRIGLASPSTIPSGANQSPDAGARYRTPGQRKENSRGGQGGSPSTSERGRKSVWTALAIPTDLRLMEYIGEPVQLRAQPVPLVLDSSAHLIGFDNPIEVPRRRNGFAHLLSRSLGIVLAVPRFAQAVDRNVESLGMLVQLVLGPRAIEAASVQGSRHGGPELSATEVAVPHDDCDLPHPFAPVRMSRPVVLRSERSGQQSGDGDCEKQQRFHIKRFVGWRYLLGSSIRRNCKGPAGEDSGLGSQGRIDNGPRLALRLGRVNFATRDAEPFRPASNLWSTVATLALVPAHLRHPTTAHQAIPRGHHLLEIAPVGSAPRSEEGDIFPLPHLLALLANGSFLAQL
jgi:hypothetical protein